MLTKILFFFRQEMTYWRPSKKDFKIQEKPPAHRREKILLFKKRTQFFVVVGRFGCLIRIRRADWIRIRIHNAVLIFIYYNGSHIVFVLMLVYLLADIYIYLFIYDICFSFTWRRPAWTSTGRRRRNRGGWWRGRPPLPGTFKQTVSWESCQYFLHLFYQNRNFSLWLVKANSLWTGVFLRYE